MYMVLRPSLAFALALMLALTGQSMAVARGSTDVAGQMVLCTGTGPVTVYMDADGQPVPPPHHCPDCVVGLAEVIVPSDVVAAWVAGLVRTQSMRAALVAAPNRVWRAVARGPPLGV